MPGVTDEVEITTRPYSSGNIVGGYRRCQAFVFRHVCRPIAGNKRSNGP